MIESIAIGASSFDPARVDVGSFRRELDETG